MGAGAKPTKKMKTAPRPDKFDSSVDFIRWKDFIKVKCTHLTNGIFDKRGPASKMEDLCRRAGPSPFI